MKNKRTNCSPQACQTIVAPCASVHLGCYKSVLTACPRDCYKLYSFKERLYWCEVSNLCIIYQCTENA